MACGSPAAAPDLEMTATPSNELSTTTSLVVAALTSTVAPSSSASSTSTVVSSLPVTSSPPVTAPSTTTTAVANETVALEFVDGALLGIAQGSSLTSAMSAFGVTPVPYFGTDFDPPVNSCTGTPEPWVIRSGGLTLVFEGSSEETAVLTNWTYTGGPTAGFAEIVAPGDMRIGDPRSKFEAANPTFTDYGGELDVGEPFFLRYGFENDVVSWFGIIDCAFEQQPVD